MAKTGKSGLNRFKCMGRPPTKAVCLTGVLKRSGKTVDLIAFEAGLIYSSRLYKVVLDLPTLTRRNLRPPKVPEGCADAMRPTVPLKEWLQSSLFRKGHDKTTQLGRRPLVIARGAGQFEAATFPKEQLMMWAEFWRNRAVVLLQSHGLGLAVCRPQSTGVVIARGVLDSSVTWKESMLLLPAADGKAATLLGPASLVNSACADCANAELKRVGNTYEVELRCQVQAGEEILCCYEVDGEQMLCNVCKGPVRCSIY